jgi:MFS family permease
MQANFERPAYWPEIRVLLLGAMAIFLYTIGIGILNGADIVDFDQRRVLGHVHGGTLGWLTLSVFAASLWLFGGERAVENRERKRVRLMAQAAILAFAAYVAAFSLTYGIWRPITGAAAGLAITAFAAWVVTRATRIELTVPHWGFLAAVGFSVVGAVLGVLLGLRIATGDSWISEGAVHAHPGAMVLGFLTPIALGICEWMLCFPSPPRATRAGILQMVFLFTGGMVFVIGSLLSLDAIIPVALMLQIAALGIFFRRTWRQLRAVRWLEPAATRYAALAPFFAVFVLGLAFYFAIRYEGDFDLVPLHQGIALDHAQFLGSVTNGVFAMLLAATVAQGRGSRADQLVFVLVNAGLAGFLAGLFFDVTWMKRIFAPAMGAGLLLGMAVFAMRLVPVRQPGVEGKGLTPQISSD